jgi:hypothetical protein
MNRQNSKELSYLWKSSTMKPSKEFELGDDSNKDKDNDDHKLRSLSLE